MAPRRNPPRACKVQRPLTRGAFDLFPKLPLEIRLMIWRATFADLQPLKMIFELAEGMPVCIWDAYDCGIPPPPSLHINQESREETMKYYQLFHYTDTNSYGFMLFHYRLCKYWIHKSTDTIVFDVGDFWIGKAPYGDLAPLFREFFDRFPLLAQTVRTLQIDAVRFNENDNWIADHGEGTYQQGSNFIGQLVAQFPCLERLILQELCVEWEGPYAPIGRRADWEERITRIVEEARAPLDGNIPKVILKKTSEEFGWITFDKDTAHRYLQNTRKRRRDWRKWQRFWMADE